MIKMNKPNLFIVGAPKCGTTSVYKYLSNHPEIFFPIKKLFNYFSRDLTFEHPRLPMDEYLSFYKNTENYKYRGDASTFHLFSKVAAKEIKEFSPNAKCIILLRDPCNMLYSYHSELLFSKQENIKSFEEALNAEDDRKSDKNRVFRWKKEAVFYSDIGRFSEQVCRYLSVFERHKLCFILFDDLKSNPQAVYKNLLAFLQLDESHQILPVIHNPNKVQKSKMLGSFINSSTIRNLARLMFPTKAREKIHVFLNKLNTRHKPRPLLSLRVKRRILKMYEDEGVKLSKLLGRDVTHWYEE
jgi:hypothetical protein